MGDGKCRSCLVIAARVFKLIVEISLTMKAVPATAQLAPALFVFGDSLADVGNNNYLQLSLAKADFPHNGIDFPASKPTGRFSNGKNAADFLAEKLGVPSPPPYLDLVNSRINNFYKGVSFASGGAGIFNATDQLYKQSIPLTKQIEYYSTVRDVMAMQLGKYGLRRVQSKAIHAIIIGSNDVFGYYRSDSDFSKKMTPSQFVSSMVNTIDVQLQRIYDIGGRKFFVIGVGAVGCCPSQRFKSNTGECNTAANAMAYTYSQGLVLVLERLRSHLRGFRYTYFDTYTCLPISQYCANRTEYLFWDLFHPTEAADRIVIDSAFDGPRHYTYPFNLRKVRRSRKSNMSFAFYDENISLYYQAADAELESSLEDYAEVTHGDIIPSAQVLKNISRAFESGKKYGSIKDIVNSSTARGTQHLNNIFVSVDIDDDQVLMFFNSILNAEGLSTIMTSSRNNIHGAPPNCFVAELAEIIGSFNTLKKMASFWCKVVVQLKRLWNEEIYVPGIPQDEIPDLDCCLIYQKLQLINCALSRKKLNENTIELLESLERQDSNGSNSSDPSCYAKLKSGELVLRLGATHTVGNMKMLETEEPIYAPQSQEGPLLTEDFIKENEELVLRTGSVGVGCSRLLSDMQAFKAANPGCILEDFVRWYSPPDWSADSSDEGEFFVIEGSQRGQLSARMQKEGNLWHKLWENSKPVAAVRQVPLFDEGLAVKGILSDFESISPSCLFKQLFLTLLSVGLVLAEATLSDDDKLSSCFYEHKDYVVLTCQSDCWTDKIHELCEIYESVETMLINPDEYMRTLKQREENSEPNSPFKRLSLLFRGKSTNFRKSNPKESRSLVQWPSFLPF
ncbi:hypothetical protein V2J09_002450 [Rumex salicifolius]